MSESSIPELTKDSDSQNGQYLLSLGNKILSVKFNGDSVTTAIINRDFAANPFGESENNSPGETTALYRGARELMQNMANETGSPFRYVFTTGNPRMIEWGMITGNEIFGWEEMDIPDDKVYFRGQVVIKPDNTGVVLDQTELTSE